MIRLADKNVVVPHWHIPLMTVFCLGVGVFTEFIWLTGIGIFFAGLQCSIVLPIWQDLKTDKDARYLRFMRATKVFTFWYWFVPIAAILLAVGAVIKHLLLT
ncbi:MULTISPECIES: hypothetical protein [unclassified Vibrio]|uniref:hypothetical protein n=1 Tax=unclassified Vibrio TaxID=2614977 RepID=UPI000C81EA1C|nr:MULTISPECIES: hypothetical protein [unclassified Vibrio]PMN40136.1 hypothetical protein BCT34_03135 [Vibrio sp. 10N.261.45.E2]PMN47360.1 hypothetical protein BCT32_10250 [Vibrio sp. 10N.261.45.E11]